jgi:Domain of unknown function (DUF4062)
MPPRFQVFLSSTFRDLREERQAALEAILELGHFPAGMEAFPAADATPWELIKTIIADSDYYVLIVGGKYGSTGPDGISYTEMEFNLAEELKKPILAFIHGESDQIPAGKTELEPEARRRLQGFRERVGKRICKPWTNKENLKAGVLLALVHAIRAKPAFGWVRNEGLENQELLRRLASLQERYDNQEAELQSLRASFSTQIDIKKYRGLDSKIDVAFKLGTEKAVHHATVQLSEIFFASADEMLVPCSEFRLRSSMKGTVIASLPAESVATYTKYSSIGRDEWLASNLDIEAKSIASVLRQFLALGLVEPEMVLRQSSNQQGMSTVSQRCWVLTNAGRAKYLEKRALPAGDG